MNEYNLWILWDDLHSRFDHTRTIFLPAARHDWVNLRVQDHKTIAEYNSELFRIVAQLTICGQPVTNEEQIEKTLLTLHSTNLVLSTQYRNMRFTKYLELIAHMLLAEKHQLLLLQNTRERPPGTIPPQPNPESHYTTAANTNGRQFRGRGYIRESNTFRGRGNDSQRGGKGSTFRGRGRGRPRYNNFRGTWRRGAGHQRRRGNKDTNNTRDKSDNPTTCYRCGTKGHTQKVCRAPAHLVELYKKSKTTNEYETHRVFLESPDILPEIHLIEGEDPTPIMDYPDICIVDSGTTHSILRKREFFHQITPSHRQVTTIMGQHQIEESHGPATLTLPRGTVLQITLALYGPKATQNLISFKDIRANGLHIQSSMGNTREELHIIVRTPTGIEIKETSGAHPLGFYITKIHRSHTEVHSNITTETWHRRLGHPGTSMFHEIIKNTQGIPPNIHPTALKAACLACSQGKLITRPSPSPRL